jgi:carotenoid cleavage dioxygenase
MLYDTAPLFPLADGTPQSVRPRAHLVRWTFDLADNTNTIKRETLDDMAGEFPRLDERRAGLSYRHGYFAGRADENDGLGEGFDTIAHIDFATGKKVLHKFGAGNVTSEPVFVPRGANAPEGDGWLLQTVYRGADNRSDLVILDATNISAGPVAVAELPRRVPFGFHGNWAQGV